jgi:hypothetical protein
LSVRVSLFVWSKVTLGALRQPLLWQYKTTGLLGHGN